MVPRLMFVAVLALTLGMAAPASAAKPAKSPASTKTRRRCKKGYSLKSVKVGHGRKARRVKRCVKVAPKAKLKAPVAGAPHPAAPGTSAPSSAPVATPDTVPGITKSPDDAAARAALASMGAMLKIERSDIDDSGLTGDIDRMWFGSDGSFQWNTISWSSTGGETCTAKRVGTWTFKGGGRLTGFDADAVYAIVTLTFGGQTGDEVLTFADSDPSLVYVGVDDLILFNKNAQIADNC